MIESDAVTPTMDDEVLAAAVRRLADAVLIADAEGKIVFWNAAAERLFRWSEIEAVGQRLDLIIPERLRERHWEGWKQVMATGQTKYGDSLLEVPALRRDGTPLSIAFTVSLLTDGTGKVTRVVAVVRDDTVRWQERREMNAELGRLRSDPRLAEPLD
jgi:PAS domain S-box-containing protein